MILLRQGDFSFSVDIFRRWRGMRAWWVFLVAGPIMIAIICRGANGAPDVQPPSKWVKPLAFTKPNMLDAVDPSQDYRWLLSDRQINAQNDEQFVHEVRQAVTPAGVQFAAHVLIHYDPACQSLTFHWARIWRGAAKLDRLDPSKLQVGQAAPGVEDFLFSSEKTAILLLDDVRAGDIVDYAYTIEGSNPALSGKYCGAVKLQFEQSVDRAVTRLIWPISRKLYLKNHLTEIQPTKFRLTNAVEFTWAVTNVPGLRMELQTPAWYDPYPSVQVSEFQKWPEVSRWALRLFATNSAPSPELARKIYEWNQLPDPAERVLTVLRFMQEEIRTVGKEGGAAGSEPAQPSVVLARRYGDAQDKCFLLVTVLRALKIDASPVLVSARHRQELAQAQPSANLFSHVIVQLNLDGQSYWLDPTRQYERGPLALRSWPAYGWGLVVASNSAGLTPIPPSPVQPLTTVTEYLALGTLQTASTLKLVTVAEGSDADRLRARFATTPREQLEGENLQAYAGFYPSIRSTAPLDYSDDEQQNRIETTESFAIDRIWSRLPKESSYHCEIHPAGMDDAVMKPESDARAMPLGVRFPVHRIIHVELYLTNSLPNDTAPVTISQPAFFFQRTANLAGSKLRLNFEYRSWTDAVAPDAVPAYGRALGAAEDALSCKMIGF